MAEPKIPRQMINKGVSLARAYSNVFKGKDADLVLDNLSKMCFWGNTFAENERLSTFRQGMEHAFLYILKMSKVDPSIVAERLEQAAKGEERQKNNEDVLGAPPWRPELPSISRGDM